MIFGDTPLAGVYLLDPQPVEDNRGFFARVWCAEEFEERGLDTSIAQCSISFNARRGTLRGMHWQAAPHEEVKIVRCTQGSIHDVVADLRPGSPTYGAWSSFELSAAGRRSLYIPKGCAHGFQTLVDETEVYYAISALYAPGAARGFRYDDSAFAIEWPLPDDAIVSQRDCSWPDYRL